MFLSPLQPHGHDGKATDGGRLVLCLSIHFSFYRIEDCYSTDLDISGPPYLAPQMWFLNLCKPEMQSHNWSVYHGQVQHELSRKLQTQTLHKLIPTQMVHNINGVFLYMFRNCMLYDHM